MSEILLHYKRPDPTTWVYLSSFLTIGLFFVFHRFWSMRNLDLVLLILLSPGLLIVHEGRRRQLIEKEEARLLAMEAEAAQSVLSVTGAIDPNSTASSGGSTIYDSATPKIGNGKAVGPSPDSSAIPSTGSASDPSTGSTDAAGDGQAGLLINGSEDATNGSVSRMVAAANEKSTFDAVGQAAEESEGVVRFTPLDVERYGFIWLLSVQVLILIRLLFDALMIRRPLLDPNLTAGGLLFIGVWLFIFMMANVITSTPRMQVEQGPQLGPGYSLMNMLPAIPTRPVQESTVKKPLATGNATEATLQPRSAPNRYVVLARVLAISAHLAIVVGIISIGYRHFGNPRSGVGCATLYLMMPYTAQMTGRVDHALPAALLVWAVLNYRRPLLAGIFLGAAAGLVYYPLFLIPLWSSFYWRLGVRRFALGVCISLVAMMALLVVDGSLSLSHHLMRMFGLMMPLMQGLEGVWGLGWEPIYRLPILVGFLLLSGFFAIWPAQKNLGTLIGYSASLMVAAQFWHAYGGGLYMAWFLPLLLLTIFRPNLEDRVALNVIDGGRLAIPRRPRIAADMT
jgi:hypothetical protein